MLVLWASTNSSSQVPVAVLRRINGSNISSEIKLQMTPGTYTALRWCDEHNHIHINLYESFGNRRGNNTAVSVSRAEEPAPLVFSPRGFGSHCSPKSSVVLRER